MAAFKACGEWVVVIEHLEVEIIVLHFGVVKMETQVKQEQNMLSERAGAFVYIRVVMGCWNMQTNVRRL